MSECLIDFYARPVVSVLVYPTYRQEIIDRFTNVREVNKCDELDKELNKKLCKFMFEVYQKMMISFQTLCLALEIVETSQFFTLLLGELQIHKDTKKLSQSQVSTSSSLSEHDSMHKIKSASIILQTFAVGLLYVCHKITDDFKHKYAANVWIENLKLQKITLCDIKEAESKIVNSFDFDILRPTIYTLFSVLMEEMGIKKSQFSYFTNYLLELYIQSNMRKFIGSSNTTKRITLTLSSLKLACHFLCPNLWDQNILSRMNFSSDQIEKYSRVLFGLFMDNSKNQFIHNKYRMKRYKEVSNLKIKNSSKNNKGNSKTMSIQQFLRNDQNNKENFQQITKGKKSFDIERNEQTKVQILKIY